MTFLVAVAVIVAALLVVGWRIERVVRERNDRALAIEERKVALEEARLAKPMDETPIPVGLMVLANRESEDWARDHIKRRMRELYAETRDWNQVAYLIAQEAHGTLGEGLES